jgi:hypothetical protein
VTGTDARDLLRHEAEILDQLAPLGLAPCKVALVTHQENLFLAEELVPGVTLSQWTGDLAAEAWQGRGAPVGQAVDMAAQLVEIVAGVHKQQLVLSDLSSNNVMVTPDRQMRLIDLEHAVRIDSRAGRIFTPGFGAPEQMYGPPFGPAPSQRVDLFSLGAVVFYLASGIDPRLPSDLPDRRSIGERLNVLLGRAGTVMEALRTLAPLVRGLTHESPDSRWTLSRASAFLAKPITTPARAADDGQLLVAEVDRLISDGMSHVLRTATPDARRLWPSTTSGGFTDPCNVYHGAAGVLAVLTQAALAQGHLRDGVAMAARWIGDRLFDIPRLLPGLYSGRSGTAWALFDAAQMLGDDAMSLRALELAKRMPVQWPNPDICHGSAGAGMAQFHLWLATGDPELKRRGLQAADSVVKAARQRDGLLVWPTRGKFESDLTDLVHYGFAHGVAGTGAFLLYASVATNREDYLEAARRAGRTLEAVARLDGGTARWPRDKMDGSDLMRHWCNGSSGVGAFLIRLWAVTGEQRFRELAEAAAAAVHRGRWYCSNAMCHGLGGDGDFLLDLADFTGDEQYRDWAWDFASTIHARHAIRDGLMVVADESGMNVTVDYSVGLSGTLGFLHRLRYGGSRAWMLDQLLDQSRLSISAPGQILH